MDYPLHPPSSGSCRAAGFVDSVGAHTLSAPPIPLTCQQQSCYYWGTKPSWWIMPLPHRTSTSPTLLSSISILYTQIWRGGAKSRKIASPCHRSYSWVCCCLICWVCFSVGLNLIFIIPLPTPPHPLPFLLYSLSNPQSLPLFKVPYIRSPLRQKTRVILEIHVSYCF